MKLEIYSKPDCVWCDKAKALLKEQNIPFIEYRLNVDYTKEELRERVPLDIPLTVPQIYIDGKRIGGYTELLSYLML